MENDAQVIDYSTGGMGLLLSCPLTPGQTLDFEPHRVLELPKQGKVIWVLQEKPGQYRVGVQFLGIGGE